MPSLTQSEQQLLTGSACNLDVDLITPVGSIDNLAGDSDTPRGSASHEAFSSSMPLESRDLISSGHAMKTLTTPRSSGTNLRATIGVPLHLSDLSSPRSSPRTPVPRPKTAFGSRSNLTNSSGSLHASDLQLNQLNQLNTYTDSTSLKSSQDSTSLPHDYKSSFKPSPRGGITAQSLNQSNLSSPRVHFRVPSAQSLASSVADLNESWHSLQLQVLWAFFREVSA